MSTQLSLPAQWAMVESRRDPHERLAKLRRDVEGTKASIRAAVQQLADRHGIAPRDVTYAMEGYADSLLSEVVYNLQRKLEHELEEHDPV
jgi:hypothetical protein